METIDGAPPPTDEQKLARTEAPLTALAGIIRDTLEEIRENNARERTVTYLAERQRTA